MGNLFNLNSNIFKGAKEGKLSSVIFTLLSPVIIIILSSIPVTLIGRAIFSFVKDIKFIQTYMYQIMLILNTGSAIIICFLIVKFKEKRSIKGMGFGLRKKIVADYLEGFALGIIMIGIAWIGIILFGNSLFELQLKNISKASFIMPFLLMLVAWIIQGASEEIMLRGYMLPVLGVKVGPKFAICASSLIFSGLHLSNNGITPLSIVNLVLFGVFAAFYAIRNENLWGICALHSSWNFAQQNIFGTLVSGGAVYDSSLISTTYLENNLINGGTFGPEGGIMVTIVLVVAITVQILQSRKK